MLYVIHIKLFLQAFSKINIDIECSIQAITYFILKSSIKKVQDLPTFFNEHIQTNSNYD